MDIPQRVTALPSEHPAVSKVILTGSRDRNEATLLSDWDFQVVLGSPYADLPKSEGGPVDIAECTALTRFFRTEIERIMTELSDPDAP